MLRLGSTLRLFSPAAFPGRLLLLLSLAALAGWSPAQSRPPVETIPIPGTSLLVDVPSDWRPGGARGFGVLVSLIGRGEGFPNFAIMTDPTFEPDPEMDGAEAADHVEALFEQLTSDKEDAEVSAAGWRTINGIDVHASTTSWSTVTGRLEARRLIFVYAGRPYILTWLEREERYDDIGPLIEHCAESLRLRRDGTMVGAGE